MEKLKFYFSDETTLTIPENIPVKYIINSAISSSVHNMSISILHRIENFNLLLKDIYITGIKNKVVIKVERLNDDIVIDTVTGDSLLTSWNLGRDIVANEDIYNEVITIGDR